MSGRQWSIVALVGSILAAAGGVLPWASVGAFELSGIRGDGILALAGGALAALVAFMSLNRRSLASRAVLTVLGVVLAWIYVSDAIGMSELGGEGGIFDVAIGPGIWVGGLGSILLAVAGPSAGETPDVVPPPATTSEPSIGDRLAELADLRDRGAVTAEEYEAKKAELLARL